MVLAFWKDTSDTRPVPLAVRLRSDEQFKQLSIAGEKTMGETTQVYPDTRNDSKVKGPVARFMVTRSYKAGLF